MYPSPSKVPSSLPSLAPFHLVPFLLFSFPFLQSRPTSLQAGLWPFFFFFRSSSFSPHQPLPRINDLDPTRLSFVPEVGQQRGRAETRGVEDC